MTDWERRSEEYLQLIQAILNCNSDEELNQLLSSNSNLMDEGLAQAMLSVAENIEDENVANYLRGFANNLREYFNQNQSNAVSEDDDNFFGQLLEIVIENNGNADIVYSFLRQNLDKLNLNLSSTIQQWWQNTYPNIEASQREYLAWIVGTLGNLLQQFPFQKRFCIEISIACYELALEERRQDNVPLQWATTQNNLANAYSDRIAGDRRENLEKAIACYELALEERRQDNVPLDWAMTQNPNIICQLMQWKKWQKIC